MTSALLGEPDGTTKPDYVIHAGLKADHQNVDKWSLKQLDENREDYRRTDRYRRIQKEKGLGLVP